MKLDLDSAAHPPGKPWVADVWYEASQLLVTTSFASSHSEAIEVAQRLADDMLRRYHEAAKMPTQIAWNPASGCWIITVGSRYGSREYDTHAEALLSIPSVIAFAAEMEMS